MGMKPRNYRKKRKRMKAGISLSPRVRKKLSAFLNSQENHPNLQEEPLERYVEGKETFMSYEQFKSLLEEFGDPFLDLFFDR